ncbi:MAG: adenylate/guanylate cyclase domain-containing protein [Leptolyngbyaceae cyanobacterium bins.349]|nr:adenylate/guanylate cyclase domain-containing protein [Leptolyngbyaceae cyanobacterium bins.349]
MVLNKLSVVSNLPKTITSRMGKVPLYLVMVVPLVIQVVGVVATVGLLSYRNGQQAVNEVATQLRRESSGRIEQHLDAYLSTPIQINQTNVAAAELGLLNLNDLQTTGKYFWRQMQTFDVGYISFGTPNGDFIGVERLDDGTLRINEKSAATQNRLHVYSTNQRGDRTQRLHTNANYNPLGEGWYIDAVEAGKPIWSSIYAWDDKPNILSISASYPLYDANRRLLGVLSVDQILTQISDFLSEIRVSPTARTYIMERSGNLVASSSPNQKPFQVIQGKATRLQAVNSQDALIRSSADYLTRQYNGDLWRVQQVSQLDFQYNGEQQFLLVMPWKDSYGLDWLIVVVVPESDFMAQIHQNTKNTIISCAIALALATLLGIPISRWIARQILRLSQASEALAGGQLHQTVEASGITELVTLADSFNRMAEQLRTSFTELERTNEVLEQKVEERTASLASAEAELRALFLAMNDLVIVYDRAGVLRKLVSTDARLLLSLVPEQVGKTIYELLPQSQADAVFRAIQQALDTHTLVTVEYNTTIEGQEVWFSANVSPLSDDLVIFVARDISDRKHIEDARRRAAEQLVQNEQQLRKQNQVLLELAKSSLLNQGDLKAATREITEAAVHTLDVERASVWLFNDSHTQLECIDLYERSRVRHSSGVVLDITEFPRYFRALEAEVTITANHSPTAQSATADAIDHPETEIVSSLLDTPIRSGGKTLGVICLEQIGTNRRWSMEEQSFTRSMADLMALGVVAQERQRAEAALRSSQEKFAKVFSASPDFITINSLKTGCFLDVNDSFLQKSGFSRAEVLGRTVFELDAWANPRDAAILMVMIKAQGSIHDQEIELRTKSGGTIIALLSAEVIELEGELCMLAVTKDITDRKRAEAAIQESQKKYRDLVESANSIIVRTLPNGVVTFMNTYGQQFFGYHEAEIVGQSVFGTLVPQTETSEAELKAWIEFISRTPEHHQDIEAEQMCRDGQKVWVKWSTKAIVNHQGNVVEILSVGFDISDRKRAEAALQEKEQYLRLILNNIPQQVFWKDTNLVFLGCNRNWAAAAQLDDPEAIIGKTDYDLLPNSEIADQFREQDQQIITSGVPNLHIIAPKVRSSDGKTTWLDISKIPIHDSNGQVIGILGVIDDITQRKEAEEALKAEQEKTELLLLNVLPAAIAHQLKQRFGELQDRHTHALIAESFEEVTVLFADIVNFTTISANISATDLVGLLNRIFLVFDDLCDRHGLEKIKTIGDSYMVVGGLPDPRPDHAEAIADMALDIQQEIAHLRTYEGRSIEVRIGINTGAVIAGVIGKKKFTYDLWGDVVNTASRMESHGISGKIQVTKTTYERLKSQYAFDIRGAIEVKGKGEMETYWLTGKRS